MPRPTVLDSLTYCNWKALCEATRRQCGYSETFLQFTPAVSEDQGDGSGSRELFSSHPRHRGRSSRHQGRKTTTPAKTCPKNEWLFRDS